MFSGLGAKLLVVAGILSGIALAFWKVIRMGGRLEQADQMEEANEAREKMDAVPDSSSDDTIDSLHDGKF